MTSKTVYKVIFGLHRYIGLAVGLIAIIVGLTGSLLVYHAEISDFQRHHQIGTITPQGQMLPIEVVLNTVKNSYASQPDAKLKRVYVPTKPDAPFNVIYATKENDWIENYVHPYTGAVLGNNLNPSPLEHFYKVIYELHYSLLVGDIGYKIVGTVGLLVCILTMTGIFLWPGWRKLLTGFKIKWNAHPKRVNFDIHKVAGAIAAVFLVFTFFTGFCWNFNEFSEPLIRAITFSFKQEAVSQPISGQSPLKLAEQLKTAQAQLPSAELRSVYFPEKPDSALMIRYKEPQEIDDFGSSYVYLDQYSGKVLRVDNALKPSLGDRILNSFTPLHYGTFGGLPTRILYVFVGLAPLILFITGFVMWQYRKKPTINLPTKAMPTIIPSGKILK
ncbi:PepSY-associated TM helix domain-containing protein [Nostoc sp. ChiQUE01b]|uniref:PepSY-associated TM helix domain-containing protein n=1 Tax=Nostoc sp. ChiQUE01b TaxID=3075376 RepID=UPI002AD47AE7|nr:PepSY-associated TM helix domain-containing protein [Nostoc sp. ChiQUE01b]MDZ8263001.1 PepSY-associated TM helix domain-containing protein [Nostoc sp. ChiQUE01b]